jgi:cytochrome c oxidase subunit 3
VTKSGPGKSPSGIWVAIFAITMFFAAFTSALSVRQGSGDWVHISIPSIMYVNTLALLLSSLALELSRRPMTTSLASGSTMRTALPWLGVTLLLGLVFVAGQYLAWRELAARGLYLATNPNSSFLYVFTVAHVLHLLGGIAGLLYLAARMAFNSPTLHRSSFDNTAIYWHFMGVLWLYLLVVIGVRL